MSESASVSPILDALYHGQRAAAEQLAAAAGPAALSIHEAAALGQRPRLEQLLGTDPTLVNAWSSDGFQPLGLACFFGQREAAELLLARGAELNTAARHPFHVTALHAALAGPEPGIAAVLIAAGAEVNARQQGGFTPLHTTAHSGLLELTRLLLLNGADPTLANDAGQTPAAIAREHHHPDVLQLLEDALPD
jgi:ankyrin repeat protein